MSPNQEHLYNYASLQAPTLVSHCLEKSQLLIAFLKSNRVGLARTQGESVS